MNPILPPDCFVPDVEARVWPDGRLYLYGSLDIVGNSEWGSHEYRVFSSANLKDWKDHGTSFRSSDLHSDRSARLFAPDCIYHNGRYHLFYCTSDNREGVASSKNPFGPFSGAQPVRGADGDSIDPAVLLDDDAQVYYFWGQFNLRGARLNMADYSIDEQTLNTTLLTEEKNGFHEGASIRKRNGIYYLVYTDTSRGKATCLAYATSRAPLGPYKKQGIIIDNTGCETETWNNHGSIEQVSGTWYVFYHRASQGSKYNRRVCVEPIFFNGDGLIDEVEMTTGGFERAIPATRRMKAFRLALLQGKLHTTPSFPARPGQEYDEVLSNIHDGDLAAYRYLDFSEPVTSFHARIASAATGGTIEVRLDDPEGRLLCQCQVNRTGGWRMWEIVQSSLTAPVTDVHALYLVFRGSWGRLFDVDYFWFE